MKLHRYNGYYWTLTALLRSRIQSLLRKIFNFLKIKSDLPWTCFCHRCGGNVKDYIVENKYFEMMGYSILCYNCFNEEIAKKGLWCEWFDSQFEKQINLNKKEV